MLLLSRNDHAKPLKQLFLLCKLTITCADRKCYIYFSGERILEDFGHVSLKNSASFDTKIFSLPIFSRYDLNLSYIYHTIVGDKVRTSLLMSIDVSKRGSAIGTTELLLAPLS